jgi:putative resolvase
MVSHVPRGERELTPDGGTWKTETRIQSWIAGAKETGMPSREGGKPVSVYATGGCNQYLQYRGLVAQEQGVTIVYTRVSGVAQKPDLVNQINALEAYCKQQSIKIDEWMSDIGSGLNYKRKQFNRLMEMIELGQVRRLIIAHRDRLVRFGYEYFEAFCERHHTEIVVINGENLSPEQELVRDLIAIVTVFSARLHGLCSYKKVLKDAALQKE